jgi:hypothetical protein
VSLPSRNWRHLFLQRSYEPNDQNDNHYGSQQSVSQHCSLLRAQEDPRIQNLDDSHFAPPAPRCMFHSAHNSTVRATIGRLRLLPTPNKSDYRRFEVVLHVRGNRVYQDLGD